MHRLHVNGIDLEYEETGSGEPVLFIAPVLADGFLPLMTRPALAERFRLIRYHKRGWCGSTHTPAPVSIADHAADAAALLDALRIERAHVVGHSSGAAVGIELVLDRPDLVASLSLLELSLLSVPSGPAFLEQAGPAFAAFERGDHAEAVATFLEVVSGLDWPACRALLEAHDPGVVDRALRDAETLFGIELPALAGWSFGAAQAGRIDCPVLSVLGSATRELWREVASTLRELLDQVDERTIDGAGHLLHLERPEPVASALAEFFAGHAVAVAVAEREPAPAR